MIITKLLNKIDFNIYSILLLFLAFLTGLFKEIIIIYLIIFIHELGHIFMSILFKWKITKITLYPFGGITKYDEVIDKNLYEEFIIYIFGPLFQIVLFLIITILHNKYYISDNTFYIFKNYHYSILLFNLLPIVPLDGSKLLNVFFNKIINFRCSYLLSLIISSFSLIIFIVLHIDYSYIILISFLVYELFFYIKNRNYILNKFILEKSLYKNKYKKYKKIKSKKDMYRNKKNIIKENDIYITENRLYK